MQVIPLGTNGFFPSFGRQTMCFAVPLGKTLIILDAGSGLFRLAEPIGKKLLVGVDTIHLYLSHYHLDHTFGFYAAFDLFRGKNVIVYAKSGRQVFSEFVRIEHFPVDYQRKHRNFTWVQIEEREYNQKDYKYKVRRQKHRDETSLGFRFEFENGKSLAYLTDTEPTLESINFIKGVDLLMHEHDTAKTAKASSLSALKNLISQGGHVTTQGAALIAKEAEVGKLALIHHYPFNDNNKLKGQLRIAKKIFQQTDLASDLKRINF